MTMRSNIRENPPRTLASLITPAAALIFLLASRWIDATFAGDPELQAAVYGVALALLTYLASLAGLTAQRFTRPRHEVDELQTEVGVHETIVDELLGIQATASFSGGEEEPGLDEDPYGDPDLPGTLREGQVT